MDLSDPSDDRRTLFELKEKAKWSSDPEEKKAAIKELSTHGENAISELQEIMSITSDDDIRNACVEAIKSMRATLSSSSITNSNSNSNSNNNNNNNSASQSNVGLNILLDSAHESYVKGDYKKADMFFEKVLEIEPNNLETLNGRGTLLLYRLADYDKARNCFEKVLQLDPKNMVALNSIEISNNKRDGTSQQKEKPAPPPPPSVDTSQQKEKPAPPPPAAATGTTSGADPRNPYNDPTLPNYNPDLDKKKADETSQQKEKPAPPSSSGTIPSADPRNPYNDPTLPNYNPDLDKKNDSMQSIQEPLQPYPNDALTWNNEGMSLYTLDRYEEAIRSYDKAIELDPNLATALFIRASIKAKKGETENALADLKKAIESDKEYIESAKQAKDFEIIRNDDRFKDLIMK